VFLLMNPGSCSIGGNEATLIPPVGLIYMAGVLKKAGFKCEIFDAGLKNSRPIEALGIIKKKKPKVLGLKVYYYNISWVKDLIEGVRGIDPGIKIGIGGHFVSHNPRKAIAQTGADFAVKGEGEGAILKVANNLSQGNPYYREVPGITARLEKGDFYAGPTDVRLDNLDELPFPDYQLVGGLKPYSLRTKFSPAAPIFTTRGCAFRCSFCSRHVFGNKVTYRSPENVVSEIVSLKERFGVRQIDILDDNFTLNRNFAEKILDLITKEKLGLTFDLRCGVRTESLDEQLLEKMKKAGFYKIAFGIESADNKVLELCHKQLDLEKLTRIASFAKEIGFSSTGFFIIGLPGETRGSVDKSVQLAKDLRLDIANFCMATPYPGTELYDYVARHGKFLFDPESNYDFGFYGSKVFYTLPGMDEKEIISRFNYAYRKFYTIPKILKCVSSIGSFSEFRWFLNATFSVLKGKFLKKPLTHETKTSSI